MNSRSDGSRVKKTIANTSVGLIYKLVALIANFASRTIFIAYLGIEYTSVSSVFTQVLMVLSFAELGIGSAITYSLYKPLAEKDYCRIAGLMNLYKAAYRTIAAVVFLVGAALLPFVNHIITDVPNVKEDIRLIYFLYVLNTSVSYLLIYKSTLLTANQQGYVISAVNAIFVIVRTIFQIVVIAIWKDFILYLILTIAFTALQNGVSALIADKKFTTIKAYPKERVSKEERKSIFKNVKALSLYKVSGTVLNGTNSIIVSSMISSAIVGFISNYSMIINEIYALALQFLSSVTSSIGNLAASEDRKRQYLLFRIMNFVCTYFFALCSVCLYVLLDEFVGDVWLGGEYIIDKWLVFFLCFDFFLKGNTTLVASYRDANGLFVQGQYRPLIMAIINIIASITGALVWGAPGVYAGSVIARLVTQFWFDPYVIYKHAFKEKVINYFKEYAVWFVVVVLGVMVSAALNSFIKIENPLISFIVHGTVCAVAVTGLSLIIYGRTTIFKETVAYIKGFVTKRKA